MSEQPDRKDIDRTLFLNLIIMLGSSAMQQLGKTMNPEEKTENTNLQGAQISIDMLEMLQAKTQGNLVDDEKRILAETLTSLRMSYVEAEAHEKSKASSKQPQSEPEKKPEQEESKVKFRKTYGEQ